MPQLVLHSHPLEIRDTRIPFRLKLIARLDLPSPLIVQTDRHFHFTHLTQVDGRTFKLFGAPNDIEDTTAATQISINYTATHTIVEVSAAASIVVAFFSSVSPNNHLRQSLPFSYVTLTVAGSFNMQILNASMIRGTASQGTLCRSIRKKGQPL